MTCSKTSNNSLRIVGASSCAYARSVTFVLEWPRSLLTASSRSPLLMRSLPNVRLNVWGLTEERFSPELVRGHPRA